jgi:hypothetical protein
MPSLAPRIGRAYQLNIQLASNLPRGMVQFSIDSAICASFPVPLTSKPVSLPAE